MTGPVPGPRLARSEGRLLALLGIVLLSLGMRTATSAFSPVFDVIQAELGIGPVVLGIVGSLPPFAFAVAGAFTPALARRLGVERALLVAILAIVGGQVARGAAGDAVAIVATTAVTTLGIGIANVLLPSLVKRYFPDRIGLVTAVATTLFAVGGTSPAFLAVPASDAIGWRATIALWGITVALAALPWAALARGHRTVALERPTAAVSHVRIARSPLAWALVAVLWASAMVGYAGTAWLPLLLTQSAGLDPATAGIHLGIMLLPGIPVAVLVPLVAARARPAAVVVAAAGILGAVGWSGLLFAPAAAPVVWALITGCGAFTFPLVLVQVAVRAASPAVAVRLSGFVQTVGYILTGASVLAMGVLHEATGDWVAPFALALAISVLPLGAIAIVARPGRVDDPAPGARIRS